MLRLPRFKYLRPKTAREAAHMAADRELPPRRIAVGGDRRHDEGGKDQIHPHQLNGYRHDQRKEHIETDALHPLTPAEPDEQEDRGQDARAARW